MKSDLSRLLRPRTIAVVGGAFAAMVIRQCRLMNFEGEIWPVHPTKDTIEGVSAFRSIDELPAAPDATFIGVNRHLTLEIVAALAKRGGGGAVCYASGFLEADSEGASLQAELVKVAGDMPILGPNCYGFINYVDGALLWPDQHGGRRLAPDEQGVAIITQSSNIAINLSMQRRGLPVAFMLTAGNQAMVGLSDMALAVLDNPRVTCLGMHIEGFDSLAGMEAVSRKARQLNKPVVILKVGKSEQAQQATLSHTASLAGAHAASQAFIERLGFGRVETLPAFLETLKLLHVHGALPGYRLGSMSCSGGEASLIADAAQGKKIHFPLLSAAEKSVLNEALGPMVTVNNPLDYHTYVWGDVAKMTRVYAGMLAVDTDLTLLIMDLPRTDRCTTEGWEPAFLAFEAAVAEAVAKKVCAVLTVSLPENIPEAIIQRFMEQGIAVIGGIEETLIAAEVAANIGQAWQKPEAKPVMSAVKKADQSAVCCHLHRESSDELCIDHAIKPLSKSSKPVSVTLDEATAKAVFKANGIAVPQGQTVHALNDAITAAEAIGYPIALKALGIAHKTEANAVRLNLQNSQQLSEAFADLQHLSEDLYLEAMVQRPVAELIVGLSRDPLFGLVMTIGAGGILVELLQDSVTLLLPSSREVIDEALGSLKAATLLRGYRGKPVADMAAAVDAIINIQQYALSHADQLQELDINPLMVCEAGAGAYAADALIVIHSDS
jgi:acyl-CoA synthetase (NDP forming)